MCESEFDDKMDRHTLCDGKMKLDILFYIPHYVSRSGICHKLYTDQILGNELYPPKYRKIWPLL